MTTVSIFSAADWAFKSYIGKSVEYVQTVRNIIMEKKNYYLQRIIALLP